MTFVGESGIDYGGPRREFFRLLLKELSESDLLLGGRNKYFRSKVQAIQVNSELISNSNALLLFTEK